MAAVKKHETRKCAKCQCVFLPAQTRECHHPAVNKIYGKYMCCYCCRSCKYGETVEFIFGTICTYGKGKDDNQ